VIYFTLIIVNILFIYFIKSDNKYWLLSIPLSIALTSGFFGWRIISDNEIYKLNKEYWKTTEKTGIGDYNKLKYLQKTQEHARKNNTVLIYLIGLQTFITFFFQVAGRKLTKQNPYKWTSRIFGILFILIFILIVLMGIVPSTGYVT